MVKVIKQGISHYIEGYVKIKVFLTNVQEGDEISDEQAIKYLEDRLVMLADADGAEFLANSKPILKIN